MGRGAPLLTRRRSEEHTSELQSHSEVVCRLLLEKKNPERWRRHTARPRGTRARPPCRERPAENGGLHFFVNDTATTEIYTLSLHHALPICRSCRRRGGSGRRFRCIGDDQQLHFGGRDRKSTRLNSSHTVISYAVFCLK